MFRGWGLCPGVSGSLSPEEGVSVKAVFVQRGLCLGEGVSGQTRGEGPCLG